MTGRRACHALAVAVAIFAALAGLATRADAETRRIAIVVGSNRGENTHPPLRFAEADAAKFAAVLTELGGLAATDVLLLRGPAVSEVYAALEEAKRRIAHWHAEGRGQVVLFFYFSGHSDGMVLELGSQGLPFSTLRRHLTQAAADVRVTILDSCKSGALLALKGGTLGQPFDIRLADDLASTGEAMIASSAANESALESSEIGASFFSHHFISGLRGAADVSGDGVVTLAEAYQYAFVRTLRTTSETTLGPQHPAYDYHLAGRGDLVLTQLQHPSAVLGLPAGFDRLLLVATPREQVLAEIAPRSAHRIAVPPGNYRLRGWRGSRTFGASLTVAQGQELQVAAAELLPTHAESAVTKGDVDSEAIAVHAQANPPTSPSRFWSALVDLGILTGAARDAFLAGGRLGVQRTFGSTRLAAILSAGTGRAPGMREYRVAAEILPSWWLTGRHVGAGLGLGLGAGSDIEHFDPGQVHWTGLAFASPSLLLEAQLGGQMALTASAELPLTLLRRDDRVTVTAFGCIWLGLSRTF